MLKDCQFIWQSFDMKNPGFGLWHEICSNCDGVTYVWRRTYCADLNNKHYNIYIS